MIDKKIQDRVDLLFANEKLQWHAITPDNKLFKWHPDGFFEGDPMLTTLVESIIEDEPHKLKLNYSQTLPADRGNPHSVRLALQVVYQFSGFEKIQYFGNVPNLDDVTTKIPKGAVE
jgi:hypothetical protein